VAIPAPSAGSLAPSAIPSSASASASPSLPLHQPREDRKGQCRHAQGGIADLDAQAVDLLAELAVLPCVPGYAPHVRVHRGDPQQVHGTPASLRELPARLVVHLRLLLCDPQAPAIVQLADMGEERERGGLGRLGQGLD
jgi:hypothetical protein